ncbi:MAG: ABC transporter permease, partial [Candidatus Cloacimonetes bacterium]|nr:ABC transporter permease [Candidatus Cloacimonadota bacterium]
MLKNYLKISWRSLKHARLYSLLNIGGLAIGIAACLLITLWIQDELTHDRFHENDGRIYQIPTRHFYGNEQSWGTGAPPAVAPALKKEYPEVLNSCRLINGTISLTVSREDKIYKEELQMADPALFEIFTFPFRQGSCSQAKNNIFTIILSSEMAEKYFGAQNPLGQFLTVDNRYEFEIIGVLEPIPANSMIRFDFFIPLEWTNVFWGENYLETWYNCSFICYALLAENADYHDFNDKIKDFITRHYPESDTEPFLYPFHKVYLYMYGRWQSVKTVAIITGFILFIAWINFINISTARSAQRAHEIGLRKVIGARRKQLVIQFLIETMLITTFALVMALILVELLLPLFNDVVGKNLTFQLHRNSVMLIGLPLLWIITVLGAGLYPALFLSSFRTITAIKADAIKLGKKSILRKILVITQFSLSIILIISTLVIYNQTSFLLDLDLGYNKENLVHVSLEGKLKDDPELLRQSIQGNPLVKSVTFLSRDPTSIWTNGSGWSWEGKPEDLDPFVTYQGVDHQFLKTFQIEMAQGDFYTATTSGHSNLVINESFASKIGQQNPIGMTMTNGDEVLTIIGVVKNFHYQSAHHQVGPMALYLNNERIHDWLNFEFAYIRVDDEHLSEAIEFIKETTRSLIPEYPVEVYFLDEDVDRLYSSEKKSRNITTSFALLALLISSLGLFGLSTFMSESRKREIGIRRVLGSSVLKIMRLLTTDYIKLVLMANLIAWPLAYYLMQSWINSYPFRIQLHIHYFIFASLIALLIAILTVSYNSM